MRVNAMIRRMQFTDLLKQTVFEKMQIKHVPYAKICNSKFTLTNLFDGLSRFILSPQNVYIVAFFSPIVMPAFGL